MKAGLNLGRSERKEEKPVEERQPSHVSGDFNIEKENENIKWQHVDIKENVAAAAIVCGGVHGEKANLSISALACSRVAENPGWAAASIRRK